MNITTENINTIAKLNYLRDRTSVADFNNDWESVKESYIKEAEECEYIFTEHEVDNILAITEDNKEMLDCIHNLMAILDSPVGCKHNKSEFADEAREIGRKIMRKHKRSLNPNFIEINEE